MTKCPECGAPVDGESKECRQCGAGLEGSTQSFAPVGGAEEAPNPIVATDEGPLLVVRKGHEVGERFYVDRDVLTIGRDPESDIFLNDVTVSRHHACLRSRDGVVSVEDAGSLNGTYVNGACVDSARLAHGDSVQVGTFQMVFMAPSTGE